MKEASKKLPLNRLQDRIITLRGRRVILDADLAFLYGVPTKVLKQAVKRDVPGAGGSGAGAR